MFAVRFRAGDFNRYAIPVIIALQILFISPHSYAADCARLKDRIEHYEQLRHGGGKARQMNHWQITIDDLEEKLKQCKSANSIHIASGATSKSSRQAVTKTTRRHVETPLSTVTYTQTPAQKTAEIITVRKLKDCIKPNNLIDNEVSECMKGNVEPEWKR